MPSIPAGFAEATFVFQCAGRPKQATWSLGIDSANFGVQSPEDIAILVAQSFGVSPGPYQAGLMSDSWTWLGVQVVKQLEDGPLVGGTTTNRPGINTAAAPPVNCCVLMTKATTAGGRRNRGRAFLPPLKPGESDIDAAGVISPAQLTAMTTAYTAAYDSMVDVELQPVLFHGSAPFTPTPVTGFVIQSIIATQRRRLRS